MAVVLKPRRGRRWLRWVGALFALLFLVVGIGIIEAWNAFGREPAGAHLERLRRSRNYQDGVFINRLPPKMDSWKALKRWLGGGAHRTPDEPVAVLERRAADFAVEPASGLRITWFGHSSMLVEIDGRRFLTDPVWGPRASPSRFVGPKRFFAPPIPLEELPELDAVILSHDHYDHLDYPTIRALAKRGVPFVVPLGVGSHLAYWGVAQEKIVELDWWEETRVAGVTLVATPARHFSGRFLGDQNATLWAGWAILGPKRRVFFSGDTGMFPEFEEIGATFGPFDATMIEVGAYDQTWADVHLGPEQAVEAHKLLRGGLLVPVHWGTFNLAVHSWVEPVERLIVAAEAGDVRLAVPRPGESVEPSAPLPRPHALTRWWPQVPWQTVDQAPAFSSGLVPAR